MSGFNKLVDAREGKLLVNSNDMFVGQAILRYGEYSEIEAQMLRGLVKPGSVVVEVGANLGTHTLVLANAVGPRGFVYAYEPQRVVFQTLCANLALNSVTHVDARHAAAGDQNGVVLLPDFDYTGHHNYGVIAANGFTHGRKVRKVRLDDDLALAKLRLIKIDVEGMELEVLSGAEALISVHRPILYVENDRVEKSAALISHIAERGYRLYWHLPPLFNPENWNRVEENIWPNIVSVNMLCLPREMEQSVEGSEITTSDEHPLRREK